MRIKLRGIVVVNLIFLAMAALAPSTANALGWRTIYSASPSSNVLSVAVTPASVAGNPSVIFAGAAAGIIKSENGGLTWTLSKSGVIARGLATTTAQPGVIYAATVNGLYKSVDYGTNWNLINGAIKWVVAVSPFSPDIIFGDNFKSTDGGQNWSPMAGLPPTTYGSNYNMPQFSISLSGGSPGFMVAVFGGNNYKSIDGGNTWTYAYYDGDDTAYVDPVDSRYIYSGR